MGLFGSKRAEVEVEPPAPTDASPAGRKGRPTPSRRQSEAARKERLNPTLSPKEARRRQSAAAREERMRSMSARENTPERTLLRNYVDSKFRVGEILLPTLVVILALSMLGSAWPLALTLSTIVLYLFIVVVLIDIAIMWRGYKKLLAERHPKASPRGLLMSGANRCIQIRRFRMPPPAIKRGDAI